MGVKRKPLILDGSTHATLALKSNEPLSDVIDKLNAHIEAPKTFRWTLARNHAPYTGTTELEATLEHEKMVNCIRRLRELLTQHHRVVNRDFFLLNRNHLIRSQIPQ